MKKNKLLLALFVVLIGNTACVFGVKHFPGVGELKHLEDYDSEEMEIDGDPSAEIRNYLQNAVYACNALRQSRIAGDQAMRQPGPFAQRELNKANKTISGILKYFAAVPLCQQNPELFLQLTLERLEYMRTH